MPRVIKDLDSEMVTESGLKRSDDDGKVDYTLALDGPMFKRYAEHMTKAASTRGPRNWLKSNSQEDHDRFQRGFMRHVVQYLEGLEDEDHAAAIIFALNGMEHVKGVMESESAAPATRGEEESDGATGTSREEEAPVASVRDSSDDSGAGVQRHGVGAGIGIWNSEWGPIIISEDDVPGDTVLDIASHASDPD